MPEQKTANISIESLESFDNGQFEIVFNIETVGCIQSHCAGFDATMNGDNNSEIYSFAGWAEGDSDSESFTITRTGTLGYKLVSVSDIESPEILCYP